jgi:SAM-dependent methyltransferase
MSRRELALKRIRIAKGRGLELGPLYSPIVSKQEANISYLDHMSTKDLQQKYKDHPIPPEDLQNIAPVDYVLKNNSLKETLKGKKFDYVIACHVIEHIPDMVRWLADVEAILQDGGILSLVIPDKRFTFDILRNESRPADVLGAYLDQQVRTSSVVMYDFVSEVRENIIPAEVWRNPRADYSKKPGNPLQKAYDECLANLQPDNYVDSHCFVLTPYSFFAIIRSLIEHDLFGYEIAYFQDTPENELEFYVSLRKAKSSATKRLKSLPQIPKPVQKHELEQKIMRLQAQKAELKQKTAALSAELHHVTTSKSWKITKPIRGAISTTKKLRLK